MSLTFTLPRKRRITLINYAIASLRTGAFKGNRVDVLILDLCAGILNQ